MLDDYVKTYMGEIKFTVVPTVFCDYYQSFYKRLNQKLKKIIKLNRITYRLERGISRSLLEIPDENLVSSRLDISC